MILKIMFRIILRMVEDAERDGLLKQVRRIEDDIEHIEVNDIEDDIEHIEVNDIEDDIDDDIEDVVGCGKGWPSKADAW